MDNNSCFFQMLFMYTTKCGDVWLHHYRNLYYVNFEASEFHFVYLSAVNLKFYIIDVHRRPGKSTFGIS